MREASITLSEVSGTLRFDSKYFISRINPVLQEIYGGRFTLRTVADFLPEGKIWSGNIFSRVYAEDPTLGKPLLVPYDLFRYVPWSDKVLSESQNAQYNKLAIKRGTAYLVCSGRNLGPISVADKFCENFCMSHDMVRIDAGGLTNAFFYVVAFLSSKHGQAAVRTDMNGSVIDHTNEKQVAAIRIPILAQETMDAAAKLYRIGFRKREKARQLLAKTRAAYDSQFSLSRDAHFRAKRFARRFAINRSSLVDRIDVEPLAPQYQSLKANIVAGGGRRLDSLAEVAKPAGRYKTNYVTDAAFGVPMMNGRQIAQYQTIAMKLMNISSFKTANSFLLERGMTLLTADGRAEENLADCVMVADDRNGWAASGHVHRVKPRPGVHPGLVYLACASTPVQAQLKALATGSVVDALSEADVSSVIVPYADTPEAMALGDAAVRAWDLFAAATAAEDMGKALLEGAFSRDPVNLV
ncbi:hypothetical protein [Brevundimonas aurantiaca]|uniref:Type I restriction modification DNA specificity domain-containing protein n=1 Tax=Brevundimonas aurantiaca TaxID=74316 RepID=A0A7W9C9E5_9CAUL|nr:hypothetical protein [Brevundimonas aurantiaca]MBB5741489.1 hypothetical protein [Brevundimonas aurantiaca]